MTTRWEEKYRPARFSEVHGQEDAVRLLSGFVLTGIAGRHVLFHGAVGSGKTSLARMLGKALNCQGVGGDGSPCQTCSACLNDESYFFEYNVAGAAGDMQKVHGWVAALNRSPPKGEVRVLFLDEAHALSGGAQDSILKEVENADPSVLFCFATSEPEGLRPALRSRLMDVRIHALDSHQAFALLQNIARKEEVACDDDALRLLIAVKPPYARDLIIALQHIAGLGSRVEVDLVKRTFDATAGDYLERYFIALIERDARAKAATLAGWRVGKAEKIRWIQRFLVSAYYNDIAGQRVVVEPFIDAIPEIRARVIAELCSRCGVQAPVDLLRDFESLLQFWTNTRAETDEEYQINLCLFEAKFDQVLRSRQSSPGRLTSSRSANDPWADPDVGASCGGSSYLQRDDVRSIVNRSSFLTQHHGVHMNVALVLDPQAVMPQSELSACEAIQEFARRLEDRYAAQYPDFASITLIERDGDRILGRIVAHIPELSDNHIAQSELENWCRDNLRAGNAIGFEFGSRQNRVRFHWGSILSLCAGFENDEECGDCDDLRKLLKIPYAQWRSPGPVDGPLLSFSSLLSTHVLNESCANEMQPLSAFDAKQWDFVSSNWEELEFRDRREIAKMRARSISDLERRFQNAPNLLRQEKELLQGRWRSQGALGRPRTWRGWWV